MMRIVSAILRNVNLLNLLLAAAIIVSINYAVLPYLRAGAYVAIPAGKAVDEKQEETAMPVSPANPETDYLVVADNNLFNPERKIPVEQKEAAPLPTPELTLYGTVVAGGVNVAFVEDKKAPVNTPGRGQRQTVLKQGDAIGGFVLREVHPDRIVLTRGEEKMVVRLDEGQKQRPTETTGRGAPPGQAAAPGRAAAGSGTPIGSPQPVVAPQAPRTSPPQRRLPAPAPRARPTINPQE